jgi:hypothetical protein
VDGHAADVLADQLALAGVLPDAVHLTALGELEVADRAARALGLEPLPSTLAEPDHSRRGAIRYALTGRAAALTRDRARRLRER